MAQTKETLAAFNGKVNVTHIIQRDGDEVKEAWLSKPAGFTKTKDNLGADSLDVSPDGKWATFYAGEEELDSFRLSNNLQGKTPAELVAMKPCLLFFQSWFPAEKRWVNNLAKGTPREKSANAVSI